MKFIRKVRGKYLLQSIQFLTIGSFFFLVLFYYLFFFGLTKGMALFVLVWGLYILAVPAAHGRIILGYPSSLFFHKIVYPEHALWSLALVLSIAFFLVMPDVFLLSLPAHILYHLLSHPNPCWLIFVVSLMGAGYRYVVGCDTLIKIVMRYVLMVAGILLFFYLAHREMIILLTVHMV